MIDKRVASLNEALAGIGDGATIHINGFGESGCPTELVHALIDQGAKGLTVVSNNAGDGPIGLAALIRAGRVRKMICSFPRTQYGDAFRELYAKGEIELEIVAQGTLSERIRAAGAGIGAFYTPTTAGTPLARGKETRKFGGRDQVLETPLGADFALVKAERADRWGNLAYNKSARNFGPSMCMAAATTIVQAREIVELGAIDPEHVVTPGIFVDRVVEVPNPISEHEAIQKEAVGS